MGFIRDFLYALNAARPRRGAGRPPGGRGGNRNNGPCKFGGPGYGNGNRRGGGRGRKG